jgi:hypothetical protein
MSPEDDAYRVVLVEQFAGAAEPRITFVGPYASSAPARSYYTKCLKRMINQKQSDRIQVLEVRIEKSNSWTTVAP